MTYLVIGKWKAQSQDIFDSTLKRRSFRVNNKMRDGFWPLMENELNELLVEKRKLGGCIGDKNLKAQATIIYKRLYSNTATSTHTFDCSDGWFRNFLYRWKLVLRRVSTTGRDLPQDTYNTCATWVQNWYTIFSKLHRNLSLLANMDETSIYLDFPSAYTYEKIGTRRVKASTAGSERTRISAAFTAFADGTKSKIYLILP
jgi:Tc5 transposase DNA-binding domain